MNREKEFNKVFGLKKKVEICFLINDSVNPVTKSHGNQNRLDELTMTALEVGWMNVTCTQCRISWNEHQIT